MSGTPGEDQKSSAFTGDYIAYHAASRPSQIAIIDRKRQFTYAEMRHDLGHFVRAARAFDLRARDIVAIEWTTFYEHWLLLLAFESLGIATLTYTKEELGQYRASINTADLVIGTAATMPEEARRTQLLTPRWFEDIRAQEPEEFSQDPYLSAESPLRLHFTSGTTGDAKCIVRTARTHAFRVRQTQMKVGFNRRSRYLVSKPFNVQGVDIDATACLRMGGTCVYEPVNYFAVMAEHDITHISVLPMLLAALLDALPDGFSKPADLTLLVFGGGVSETLRARALETLATGLIVSYGTNEAASICTISSDGNGAILPEVRVETVDDRDQPVLGQAGSIRVKSAGCIAAYRDDPAASAQMFRNGWFYPGDIGVMKNRRTLRLLGRADDLLNIGGLKIDPEKIEGQLNQLVSAQDLCVTSVVGADGTDRIFIAVVPDTSMTLDDIRNTIGPKAPKSFGSIGFVEFKKIPRTPAGKVQRQKVRALLQNAVDGSTAKRS